MGPEPDCYRTYERTDTADWEAITGPPLKHSENAGPGFINFTRLAASNMKPVFASLIMCTSVRDRQEGRRP